MATNGAGTVDVRKADAAYRSFPSFAEWRAASRLDEGRWDRYASLLQQRAELTPELLARARDVAKRAAAVDTGALEGLISDAPPALNPPHMPKLQGAEFHTHREGSGCCSFTRRVRNAR